MEAATITGEGATSAHPELCAFSAREVWAGMAVGRGRGWGSKWSFEGKSKEDGSDRPAREGARLVIRHQEETNSGV